MNKKIDCEFSVRSVKLGSCSNYVPDMDEADRGYDLYPRRSAILPMSCH